MTSAQPPDSQQILTFHTTFEVFSFSLEAPSSPLEPQKRLKNDFLTLKNDGLSLF